jgi:hypothetical protein
MRPLLRAGLAGIATGARSFSVLAACARTPGRDTRTERVLHRPIVRKTLGRSRLGELVGDKLPVTPPRTSPPSLAGRVAFGALTGALVSARAGGSSRAGALVGAGTSAAWTFAAPQVRALAAARAGNDLPGAVAEDAAALVLARVVTRPGRG